ncbi:hypothetical protein HN51_037083 [Arachis hypogaea]
MAVVSKDWENKYVSVRLVGSTMEFLSNKFDIRDDFDAEEILILDPRVNTWNKIFLVACFISLFVDPLFFYLSMAKK